MKYTKIFVACSVLLLGAGKLGCAQQLEITLTGAYNFRDLGGYQTKDQKTIKWGKLYRSAVLSDLTPGDLDKLSTLHIARIADFRGSGEAGYAPEKIPAGAAYFGLSAGSGKGRAEDRFFQRPLQANF
ncbi:tyrosine-protein phosphatase [Pedobacter hartonius]|nr:tyrosine-protein phosphatase [Pedobacter hartonius]